jgi:hypothetical protein
VEIVRFTKSGAGERQGRDWRDAKPFASLAGHLRQAKPGDVFLIGFDRDREDPIFFDGDPLVLGASGDAANPIRIEVGYIGHVDDIHPARGPGRRLFFKNPSAWSTRRSGAPAPANRYLTLQGGVSHVRIAGFGLEGTSVDGFVKFRVNEGEKATFTDVSIQRISAVRIGRLLETTDGASINGLLVEDCDAFEIIRGFARFRSLTDSVLRNLYLDGADVDGGGKNVCQMIAVEAGSNVLFENVIMRNAINMVGATTRGSGSGYVQGDGIVCERHTSSMVIRNCHGSGMGDSAFDLKTDGLLMEDSSAYGCKFGARIWSQGNNIIRRCAIGNPRTTGANEGACVQTVGRVDVVDCILQAGPGTAIFRIGRAKDGTESVIRVFGGSIRLDGNAALVAGDGPGTVELHDVAVNGALRNRNYAFDGKSIR